jgi:hypothetical protein
MGQIILHQMAPFTFQKKKKKKNWFCSSGLLVKHFVLIWLEPTSIRLLAEARAVIDPSFKISRLAYLLIEL